MHQYVYNSMVYKVKKLNLSASSQSKIFDALASNKSVLLSLIPEEVKKGDFHLSLTNSQANRVKKAREKNQGMSLNLSNAQLKKAKKEGLLFSTVQTLAESLKKGRKKVKPSADLILPIPISGLAPLFPNRPKKGGCMDCIECPQCKGSGILSGEEIKKWKKVYDFNPQTGKDYHWVENGVNGGEIKNTILKKFQDLPHPTGTVAQQLTQNYTNPTKGSAADIVNAVGDIASAVADESGVPGASEAVSYVFGGLASAIQNYVNEGKVREAMIEMGKAKAESLKAVDNANISEQNKTMARSIIFQMYSDTQGDVEDLKNRLGALMINNEDPGPNGSYMATRQQFATLSKPDQTYVKLQSNQATRMADLSHMTAAQAIAAQKAYYQANPQVLK